MRRPRSERRESVRRIEVTLEGLPGNRWGSRVPQDPEGQIAVMRSDFARLLASGRDTGSGLFEPFGDNLFVELDLSSASLPAGSRLRIGTAGFEVTAKPHTGCRKFLARFGPGALELVSSPLGRSLNLRGIYLRAVEPGAIAIGDAVMVLRRGSG